MNPTKKFERKITVLAVAGFVLFPEAALELNCSRYEPGLHVTPCPERMMRAPVNVSCSSLVELAFPPHSESGEGRNDEPATSVSVSASGNVTNTASLVVPPFVLSDDGSQTSLRMRHQHQQHGQFLAATMANGGMFFG